MKRVMFFSMLAAGAFWAGAATVVDGLLDRVYEADIKADKAWDECKDRAALEARKKYLHEKTIEAIGGFPKKTPLNAKICERIACDGYSIEKLIFESLPGVFVTAHLALPDASKFKAPYPAILVPCGHSWDGKGERLYQRACAMGAKEGFAVLVYDPYDQGERMQNSPQGGNVHGHNTAGVKAALVGKSMAFYRVWDGIRAIDYLCSRKEIAADKIGCMGNSGGGTLTAYITALDRRVKASCPSCYISSLREVIKAIGPQDAEQCIFGQLEFGLNHAGLVLMSDAAVRIQASDEDFFPLKGTLESYELIKRVATRHGMADRYDLLVAKGPHGWKESARRSSLDWMRKWLMGEKVAEKPHEDYLKLDEGFDAKKVDCALAGGNCNNTAAGSVLKLPGARSIYDVLRAEAAKACRKTERGAALKAREGGKTLEFKGCAKALHQFYGFNDSAEFYAVLCHLLGTSLVELRADAIEKAVRAEAIPVRVIAHGSWCPAVALAYSRAPECFGAIRCVDAPESWRQAIEGNGNYRYTSLVVGGLLRRDWVDMLPSNTEFSKGN